MDNTLKILFLEDTLDDYHLIISLLEKESWTILSERVDSKEAFHQALIDFNPHVILADHDLPQFNSAEALNLVKKSGRNTPFILVTGALSDESAVVALKMGVDDYVLKSNLTRLPSVISNVLNLKQTQRLKTKATLELARRNEELSKINKELDSFVYSVSHNLRAPLMSILGLLNLAKQEEDPTLLSQYHQMMEDSIYNLDRTLKDILDYSRNAREAVKIEAVSLREVIEENFEKMAFMAGFKNFTTEIDIEENGDFYSDRYRLSVVFNNLISNAIKYADPDKAAPAIKITATINPENATIVFSDNGLGIVDHALPKVFDMFYRANNKQDGSGLGLYIVKEAVDLLEGQIRIDSDVGEGTTFKVVIPNRRPKHLDQVVQNSLYVDRN